LTASRLFRTASDFVTIRVVLATGGGTGIGALPVVADVSEAPDVTHVVDADAGMAFSPAGAACGTRRWRPECSIPPSPFVELHPHRLERRLPVPLDVRIRDRLGHPIVA
jgi:hypothetical protein